ncbi:hypothetical protein [Desulfosporosinus lacus]|uniref:hypothetical protein n=1 Tax=Desulfosporosinus lacus TaxID=329936 RepID=UPI001FA81B0F|nr:hypothetical protein [Desulfosporosinus lacus]
MTSLRRVETVLDYLKDFYPIRKCSTPRLVKRTDGCLFLQLGTCLGVCSGRVSPDEYKVYIEEIWQLLNGNDRIAVHELSGKINTAIENFNFEKVAQYSGYLLGLRHVIGKQRLVRSSSKNRNVLAVELINNELPKSKGTRFFIEK